MKIKITRRIEDGQMAIEYTAEVESFEFMEDAPYARIAKLFAALPHGKVSGGDFPKSKG